MSRLLFIITAITIVLIASSATMSPAQTAALSKIPDELIARQLKQHDPTLAISVDAVLYKLRQNQAFTMVDVRSREDFERLYIPGSVNIPLYAVKTKTYLKSAPIVLVNEGFRYAEQESECRRLAAQGFKVFILDGGLPAWQRKGGQLAGDLFALDDMRAVLPREFFREKDYADTIVVDISPARSELSKRLIPYAEHIPVLEDLDRAAADFKKLFSKNKTKPFQSIIIFNQNGDQYAKVEKIISRMGIGAFNLKGGADGYQKYLQGLVLSWNPRDSRMKTVGSCKPCGEKTEEE